MREQLSRYVSLGSVRQIVTHPWLAWKLPRFASQLKEYRRLERLVGEDRTRLRLYPCLNDDQSSQHVSYYFYQDCWAAKQVFREHPKYHVDVGSTVLLAGILSQFTRCISVDIRAVKAYQDGLEPLYGSILTLPFRDNSVPCLTSMCVLEHIGLGRFGDPLNPAGTREAAAEIARVIAPGGLVIFSVPVGGSILEFNSLRRFDYHEAADLFGGWRIEDSCILTPQAERYVSIERVNQFKDPVACFCLRKPAIETSGPEGKRFDMPSSH